MFSRLKEDLEYDLNVMYFKAVSAFNCGKYEESFIHFDNLITLYPEAVTAKYYYRQAKQMKDSGEIIELSQAAVWSRAYRRCRPLRRNSRRRFFRQALKAYLFYTCLPKTRPEADFLQLRQDPAEKLYEKLFNENRLDDAKNEDVLTAAVYSLSGVCADEETSISRYLSIATGAAPIRVIPYSTSSCVPSGLRKACGAFLYLRRRLRQRLCRSRRKTLRKTF